MNEPELVAIIGEDMCLRHPNMEIIGTLQKSSFW